MPKESSNSIIKRSSSGFCMNDLINSAAVARDISLLYELALAVGHSLDLTTNCAIFLKTLIARKNLAYAAVWLNDQAITGAEHDAGMATLVFANPEYRVRERHLPISHPMFTLVAQEPAASYCSADPTFSGLITEREITDGTFALFRLGEIGVLKLFSRTRKAPFERVELRQLGNVTLRTH